MIVDAVLVTIAVLSLALSIVALYRVHVIRSIVFGPRQPEQTKAPLTVEDMANVKHGDFVTQTALRDIARRILQLEGKDSN